MPERIEIRTFRQLLEHHHRLTCYCPGCDKTATVDLALWVSLGWGDYDPIGRKPRCRRCGQHGQWTLHSPVPDVRPKAEVVPISRRDA